MRVAVPAWNERISPVFDVASELCVFAVEDGAVTGCSRHRLEGTGRTTLMAALGVNVLICSAVSRGLETALSAAGIEVVSEVCGPIEDVVDAYLNGTLADGRFGTPAHSRRRRREADGASLGTGDASTDGGRSAAEGGRAPRAHRGGVLKYTFGPVPSRRLGRSLGIDPLPLKTCDFGCVYCQLGRTHPLVVERRPYLPAEEIVAEVEEALAHLRPGSVDWITFVGSGETTLHSQLGWMIRRLRKASDLPIAVITNGSLLHRRELRDELAAADAVLPSLDAGSATVFDHVNRPHRKLDLARIIAGLVAFRREYRGRLWLEVMLVRGLNDSAEALGDLAEAVRRIQPDEVQINVPTRPPAEEWVRPPADAALERARRILGEVCPVTQPTAQRVALELAGDVADGLLRILRRHPLRDEELAAALTRRPMKEVREVLAALADGGKVRAVHRLGFRFWCSAEARFPEARENRRGAHPAAAGKIW